MAVRRKPIGATGAAKRPMARPGQSGPAPQARRGGEAPSPPVVAGTGVARRRRARASRVAASDTPAAVATAKDEGSGTAATAGAAPAARRGSGRPDGRRPGEIRPVAITPGFIRHAEGSALIEMGHTKVVCTASVEDSVPPFLRNTGRGWVTAEYGMLPRSTNTRMAREAARGRIGGRTSEIQRLIGRCLRAVVDFETLGERAIRIDCDVLQADGGTRTAAITGGFVALAQAVDRLVRTGLLRENPLREAVAAVSVGIVDGRPVLDLAYEEDSRADVDMNLVTTASGRIVEIQGTAERAPFTRAQLDRMLALGVERMAGLFAAQRAALVAAGVTLRETRRRG